MHNTPVLSVLLPVYNSERYIKEAVNSILNQTFKDFELIIINDGSTDKSSDIINNLVEKDPRIRLISRENKGLVYSLNEGIEQARGEFIARMDADDICLPRRFEIQLDYIKKNNLDLCGTWIRPFTDRKVLPIRKYPIKHKDIYITSLFYSPFAHPSIIMRSAIFKDLSYKEVTAEDYNLWCEVLLKGYKTANIPIALLDYRVHSEQITSKKYQELFDSSNNIAKNFARKLDIEKLKLVQEKEAFLKENDRYRYNNIAILLEKVIVRDGASIQLKADILLWLYLKSQPKTPWLYYQYKKATKGYNQRNQDEILLFLKSFLYLNPDSKILNILKSIIKK